MSPTWFRTLNFLVVNITVNSKHIKTETKIFYFINLNGNIYHRTILICFLFIFFVYCFLLFIKIFISLFCCFVVMESLNGCLLFCSHVLFINLTILHVHFPSYPVHTNSSTLNHTQSTHNCTNDVYFYINSSSAGLVHCLYLCPSTLSCAHPNCLRRLSITVSSFVLVVIERTPYNRK